MQMRGRFDVDGDAVGSGLGDLLDVALGLLVVGPPVMTAVLGNKGFHYGRFGLAIVGLGMGLHLVSGTLNQAALARGQARWAAGSWLIAAALFVAFVAASVIHAEVTRVEVGYFGATALLCLMLSLVYRRGSSPAGANPQLATAAT